MKQTIKLFSVAVIAAVVSIAGYKVLETETNTSPKKVTTTVKPINLTPTNYTSNSSYKGVDFSLAAEKTVDAVVHVISTTVSSVPTNMMDYFRGGTGRNSTGLHPRIRRRIHIHIQANNSSQSCLGLMFPTNKKM